MFGKKILVMLLSVLLVLGSLTLAFGKTTVTFWSSHSGEPDRTSIQRIVDEFNKQNPDIEVKVTIVPGSETDVSKLLTAVAG
ncbi:MAG TPA: ABC transporter substrate-binding protein, partial [bacterium]|nr:ABC transporter substrate-binding protein [bacterium]